MTKELANLRLLHRQCQPTCTTTACRAGDCTLTLPRNASLCLDCDRCKCFGQVEGEKKPDYVILHSDATGHSVHWLIIEMKSRPRRPGSIVEQLQAGATILQDNERFRLSGRVRGLIPVLVKARGVKDNDLEIIRRQMIRFQGNRYPIRVANCGTTIAALIPR